jgi:hypothetical protein
VSYPTEQADWIQEVLDFNLVRGTSYSQSIQEYAWIKKLN